MLQKTKFMLRISLKLSFGLTLSKLDSQKNKLLAVHTLHCTEHTVHCVPYMQERSKLESSQGRGPLLKIILWLLSRLILSSTLSDLASIDNTYIFKNCFLSPGKYLLNYISMSCLCFIPRGTVPVNNTWFSEKVPVNKISLNKQTNNYNWVLEDSSWQYFHPSLLASKQTIKCTNISGFSTDISFSRIKPFNKRT